MKVPWPAAARAALAALLLCAVGAAPAFEDTLAQRLLACTGCHGKDGRAAADGYYPRIAGKPAGYLYNQLRAFRDGQRRYALMTELLAPLSDDYLRQIAAHFAALDLPYAAPAQADAASSARARLLATQGDRERQIPACSACHGQALTGVAPDMPGVLGLSRDYLNAQMGAWRTGSRHAAAPDCMATLAKRLSIDDINALSLWLSAQALPADPRAQPAHAERLPMACGSVPGSLPAQQRP